MTIHRQAVLFIVFVVLLGVVAWSAPAPAYVTDSETYKTTGRMGVVPDCSDIHCFRVLIAWVLEPLPGPSLLKWKIYAVLANAGAAVALGRLCLLLGFSARASTLAAWLSALGFGSFFTLYDPYSSDALMFLLGPVITANLLKERRGRATVLASIGVFAKEFAAAPLWIFALWSALQRRWEVAIRTLLSALTATLVWMTLQVTLMIFFNYTYSDNQSTKFLEGADLAWWLHSLSPRLVATSIFIEFGALYVLLPFGFAAASRDMRLFAVASIPAMLALVYVQQPDRALWNFHFVVIPFAALVLESLPAWGEALFVAAFGLSNLRFGAQLTFVPSGSAPLAVSLVLAAIAIAVRLRNAERPLAPAGASV
jgi:hypothetical protein